MKDAGHRCCLSRSALAYRHGATKIALLIALGLILSVAGSCRVPRPPARGVPWSGSRTGFDLPRRQLVLEPHLHELLRTTASVQAAPGKEAPCVVHLGLA